MRYNILAASRTINAAYNSPLTYPGGNIIIRVVIMSREEMNERIVYLLEKLGVIPEKEIQENQGASCTVHQA